MRYPSRDGSGGGPRSSKRRRLATGGSHVRIRRVENHGAGTATATGGTRLEARRRPPLGVKIAPLGVAVAEDEWRVGGGGNSKTLL